MTAEKYPIGIQTFEKLILGGFTYVDKTRFIAKLVKNDGYYFLSRPRRFGKSLLLSTLHAYFNGKRELFKGLYLDTADVDWSPLPVLHFDLNTENFMEANGLMNLLDRLLSHYESQYEITEMATTFAGRLECIIKTIFDRTRKKVVILVDEYDKPLLEIEEDKELFERNQALLKGFFGNLKSMDRYIKFAFLTGVARFNKVSIFSDLNNLNDISLTNEYADICGWSEQELTDCFKMGIKALAKERKESVEKTISAMRSYYDGYLFAEKGHRLYNPFSVLRALYERKIRPYWFSTGTPTFLVKRVISRRISLESLNDRICTEDELEQVGIFSPDPVPLMFQTGYLTISSYDSDRQRYHLSFPNKEVELGFAKSLYPVYIKDADYSERPFSIYKFQDDLYYGDPEGFMKRLQALCKSMAYESQTEENYRNIVWILCTLCGTDTLAERHSYKGRSDLEVKTRDYIYVFEFKYNGSVKSAMEQLRNRDYSGHYELDRRKIYLIAANFSSGKEDRGLTDWKIELIP